jgi:hypothetical protein
MVVFLRKAKSSCISQQTKEADEGAAERIEIIFRRKLQRP